MDWNYIGTQVIIGIMGVIFSALGLIVTYLIGKYVKDEELKTTLSALHDTVRNSVLEVYQTFVEELKDGGLFDEKAQKLALAKCISLIKENAAPRVQKYLVDNIPHVEQYLTDLIEAQIGALKNSGK